MHHSVGDVGDGQIASWGYPEGGMGAVADACRKAAEALGAEVRTNARVRKILTRGGRATGVVLENDEELHAPIVVTACHPKITFLEQLEASELPEAFVRDIEHWTERLHQREPTRCRCSRSGSRRSGPTRTTWTSSSGTRTG